MAQNKGEIDTKHFLMAIIAIVAIVAISFIAVLITNNVGQATRPVYYAESGYTGSAITSISGGDLDCMNACFERYDPVSCKNRCSTIDYEAYFDMQEINSGDGYIR